MATKLPLPAATLRQPSHPIGCCGLVTFLAMALAPAHAQVLNAEQLRPFVEVVMPEDATPATTRLPVVLFLQGTGGGNLNGELWTGWFNSLGIATVLIDNAKARGRSELWGVPSYIESRDITATLELLQNNARVDLNRYAIMGFSKGGTASMESGGYLKAGQPLPQFVFSLYPGNNGQCPNAYNEPVKVMVFYGDQDDWGTFQGNRDACQRMAESRSNTRFHLLAGAHHGYDGMVNTHWSCCGQSFVSKSSSKATEETRQIILEAIRRPWLEAEH